MSFPWPGLPAGWANQSVVGDGSIQALSTADRNRGFRIDGVATLPKVNAIVRELANQLGFLFQGYGSGGDSAGAIIHWPTLGEMIDNTPVGRVASCAEFTGLAAPFARTSGVIDATYVWTDGSTALWFAYDDGGAGASQYGSVRRQTMAQVAGVDWDVTLPLLETAVSIVGVNEYLYVAIDYTAALAPGAIRKVNKLTGQTVSSVMTATAAAVRKIVSNGNILCVIAFSVIEAYDLDLNLLWTWDRGSAIEDIAITGDAVYAVGAQAVVFGVPNVNINRISIATGLKTHQSIDLAQDLEHVTTDGRVVIATADVAGADNVITVTCGALQTVEMRQVGTVWQPRNILIDHGYIYLAIFDAGLAGTLFQIFSRSWIPVGQVLILGLGQFDTDGMSLYFPGSVLSGWKNSRFDLGFPARLFRRNDPEVSIFGLWNKLVVPL